MFNVWGPARLLSQRPRHFTCTTVCDSSSFCILTTPVIVCLWWQPSSWVWSGVSLWFGFACPSWLCVYTRYTSVLERKRTVQIVQPDPFIFQIKNLRFRKRGWKGAVPRGKLPASVFSGLNNKLHCLLISVIFKNITSHLFFKLHYLLNLFFPDIDIFLIVKTLIAKPRCHFFSRNTSFTWRMTDKQVIQTWTFSKHFLNKTRMSVSGKQLTVFVVDDEIRAFRWKSEFWKICVCGNLLFSVPQPLLLGSGVRWMDGSF